MDMKNIHLLALAAGAGALLIFAASQADAQRLGVGGGGIVPLVNGGSLPSIVPLSNGGELNRGGLGRGGFRGGHLGGGHHGGGRFHRGFGFGFPGVWVEETEVVHVIEREVVREVPVEAPAPPPAPKKPYVVGKSYDSLPSGCMKLIDDGASFYHCSGEWYREVGEGSSVRYKAVARSGSIFGG